MRLIDADAAIESLTEYGNGRAVYIGVEEAVRRIEQLPPAQPEIVRCKDCKHSRFFDPCFYCYEMGGEIIVPENGFCFKAERRTKNADVNT